MRKEVFYSLAALGLTPVAANAAVVPTNITLEGQNWTGASKTVSTDMVEIVSGGTVKQENVGDFVPGTYKLVFPSLQNISATNPLTVKVEGVEATITTTSGEVAFTLTTAKKITIEVSAEDNYTLVKPAVKLDFKFNVAAEKLKLFFNPKSNAIENEGVGYATRAKWTASLTKLKNDIMAVDAAETATGEAAENVYEDVYVAYELWKIDGDNVEGTAIATEANELFATALTAEKAELNKQLKSIKDRFEALPSYLQTNDLKNALKAVEDKIKNLKAGESDIDLQEEIADFTAAGSDFDKAVTAGEGLVAKYKEIEDQIEATQTAYAATANWYTTNLKIQVLKDAFKKEFDAEKAKLDALVQNIRDAYDNASLLKLKEDGTINTEDGKWFKKISDTEKSYKNQLDAIQKLVADKATAGSLAKKYDGYQDNFNTTFEPAYNAAIADFDAVVADAAAAKIKDYNKVERNDDGSAKNKYTAMLDAKNALTTFFNNAKAAKELGSDDKWSTPAADKFVKAVEDAYKTGGLLDAASTKIKALYTALGKYDKDASTGAIKQYYDENKAKIKLAASKREAKALYDGFVDDLADGTLSKFNQKMKDNEATYNGWKDADGFDVAAVFGAGDEKAKYSLDYFKKLVSDWKKDIDGLDQAALDAYKTGTFATNKTQFETELGETFNAGGAIETAHQNYIDVKNVADALAEKIDELDAFLQANYSKAYNDPKNIAGDFEGSELKTSYKNQIKNMRATLKKLTDALAFDAKGKKYNDRMDAISFGAPTPEAGKDYAFSNYTIGNLRAGGFAVFADFKGEINDVDGLPLLKDADYDGAASYATVMNLIGNNDKKILAIKAIIDKYGLAEIPAAELEKAVSIKDTWVRDAVDAVDLDLTDIDDDWKWTGTELSAIYGAAAEDLLEEAAAIAASRSWWSNDAYKQALEDGEVSQLANTNQYTLIKDLAIPTALNPTPDATYLELYTDIVDKLYARALILESACQAAIAKVKAAAEFAQEVQNDTEVDGVAVKPNETAQKLFEHFKKVTANIAANVGTADLNGKFYGLTAPAFLNAYNGLADDYTDDAFAGADPLILPDGQSYGDYAATYPTSPIVELAEAIAEATADGTLEDKWEKFSATVGEIEDDIQQLEDVAYAATKAQRDVAEVLQTLADAELFQNAYAGLTGPSLFKKVYDTLDGPDNNWARAEYQHDPNGAPHGTFDATNAFNKKWQDEWDKLYKDKGEDTDLQLYYADGTKLYTIPELDKQFAAVLTEVTAEGFTGEATATIDVAGFKTLAAGIVTALNALEPTVQANKEDIELQHKYVNGWTDPEDATKTYPGIEAKYNQVFGFIDVNDKTDAAAGYKTALNTQYNKFKALRTQFSAEDSQGWEKALENFEKGDAGNDINNTNLTLGETLEDIYEAIVATEEAQAKGYAQAVVDKNASNRAEITAFEDDLQDAITAAVAAEKNYITTSEPLQELRDAIAEDVQALNKYLKETNFGAKYQKEVTDYDNAVKDAPGKIVDSKKQVDNVKALIKEINDKVDAIDAKILSVLGDADGMFQEYLEGVGIANDLGNAANPYALGKLFDKKYTEGNFEKEKLNTIELRKRFGYADEDEEGNVTRNGYVGKWDAVNRAYNALNADAEDATLKALDNTILALGDADKFIGDVQKEFNKMAEDDLTPALAEAAEIYAKGEAEFGKNSDASKEDKEAWAEDALNYTNAKDKTGALELIAGAKKAKDFDEQYGKLYSTIREKLDAFLDGNLWSQYNSSDAVGEQLASAAAGLADRIAGLKTAVAGYGAEGKMLDEINELQDHIADDVKALAKKVAAGTATKAELDDIYDYNQQIDGLVPTELAKQEKAYFEQQIATLDAMYNELVAKAKAETDETKKAAAEKKAEDAKKAIDDVKAKFNAAIKTADNKDKIQNEVVPVKPAAPKVPTAEEAEQYAKDLKDYNDAVAKLIATRTANGQVAGDLKKLEATLDKAMNDVSALNGVNNADVAAALKKMISDAKTAAQEAQTAVAENEDLTPEEKQAYSDAIGALITELGGLTVTDATAPADFNKISQQVEQIVNELVRLGEDIDDDMDAKAASNTAAEDMMDGYSYIDDDGNTIDVPGIEDLEDLLEAAEEDIANEDLFSRIQEKAYKDKMAGFKKAIEELKTEVETAKKYFVADEYKKAAINGKNIFEGRATGIAKDINKLMDYLTEQEYKLAAIDLQKQADGIGLTLDPDNFTGADLEYLQDELEDINDAIYTPESTGMFGWTTPAKGLAVDAATATWRDLGGLAGDAADIQDAIDNLKELVAEKQLNESGVPGDINGDGIVSADDVQKFLVDLLKDNVPATADDPLFEIYDVNGDGIINIADGQAIQNLSLGLNIDGSIPGAVLARSTEAPAGNITAESTELANGAQRIVLNLDANFEYTGFQLDVKGAEVLSETANLSLRSADKNGNHRIVALGAAQGNGQVLTIDVQGNAQLGTITFTTADAQAISFQLSGTTGINGISTENASTSYDLSGKIVKGMKKGVNIIRDAAGKVKKTIMK